MYQVIANLLSAWPRDVVCHASAWDIGDGEDYRIKMCIDRNAYDFSTIHHELGHNFYQRAYKDQPYLLQGGVVETRKAGRYQRGRGWGQMPSRKARDLGGPGRGCAVQSPAIATWRRAR